MASVARYKDVTAHWPMFLLGGVLAGLPLFGLLACSASTPKRDSVPVDAASSIADALADTPLNDLGTRDLTDSALPPLEGPLAGLPSTPGPHIAQIQALGPDEWLELGSPAADPTWGRARGRAWGGRALILAPDIRGAFFTGEGVHAFVKPDGHAMDDIWVYDINANAWIAVHPGTDTLGFNQKVKDGELLIDDNGQLVDDTGQPIPVHLLVHAWGFLSYDPQARRFAMLAEDGLGRYFLGGEEQMEEGLQLLEAQKAEKTVSPMSPWFYDVVSGRFARQPISAKPPYYRLSYPLFQYIPSRKQYFVGGSAGVHYYDPATNTWTTETDSGPRPPGFDCGGCYDEKRDRIYTGPGSNGEAGAFYVYDLQSATWTQLSAQGTPPQEAGTNTSSMIYDTANDIVTVFRYKEGLIFTYDPAADSWSSRAIPSSVTSSVPFPSYNAFYDPSLNATFVFIASDSKDNGVMWAYRYK